MLKRTRLLPWLQRRQWDHDAALVRRLADALPQATPGSLLSQAALQTGAPPRQLLCSVHASCPSWRMHVCMVLPGVDVQQCCSAVAGTAAPGALAASANGAAPAAAATPALPRRASAQHSAPALGAAPGKDKQARASASRNGSSAAAAVSSSAAPAQAAGADALRGVRVLAQQARARVWAPEEVALEAGGAAARRQAGAMLLQASVLGASAAAFLPGVAPLQGARGGPAAAGSAPGPAARGAAAPERGKAAGRGLRASPAPSSAAPAALALGAACWDSFLPSAAGAQGTAGPAAAQQPRRVQARGSSEGPGGAGFAESTPLREGQTITVQGLQSALLSAQPPSVQDSSLAPDTYATSLALRKARAKQRAKAKAAARKKKRAMVLRSVSDA